MKNNNDGSFEEKKALIEMQKDLEDHKHSLRMKELEFSRESDKLHHEREMERQRIRTAEIRKSMERKEWLEQARRIK
jgi:hypothetical protein